MKGLMRQLAVVVLLMAGCASAPVAQDDEQLYFVLELRRQGHLLARPKLLGEAGRSLRAERRQPGAALPDYELALAPTAIGGRYRVRLDVAVPDAAGHARVDLLHGQVRTVELGRKPGQLSVSLMLMRVDSPEFRALMELSEQETRAPSI